jgi:hypothetical protein
MAYSITDNVIGTQPIANSESTAQHVLGTVVRAKDPTYGEGEFIYLLGVDSTVVGSLVTYAPSTYQTALCPNTAALAQPVAVAMSANTSAKYGWYQIGGVAVVKKTNVSWEPNKVVYISGTAGRVMDTAASGKQILGARSANVATVTTTTSTILVSINRPHAQGQVI